MVKIFYTPPGYRNTAEFLFKEALKDIHGPDYSKILYLSPASVKVHEAQRIFQRAIKEDLGGSWGNEVPPRSCYIPPEMATIMQYCKKLYSAYGNRRILHGSLIPVILSRLCGRGLGFSSMIADFISDIKHLYPDCDMDAIKHSFTDVFHDLNIPEAVAETINEGLETYKNYQSFITGSGLIDEDDVIKDSGQWLVVSGQEDSSLVTHHSLLILDGFYDPTLSEKNVLKELIQSSEQTLVAIPYSNQFKGLVEGYANFLKDNFKIEETFVTDSPIHPSTHSFAYYAYPCMEEEVEGIARNIKSLYVSGKLRDLREIIVTFPDLSKYASMVERVFHRYGIPYDISKNKTLGRIRPFLDLLSLLRSAADGYPRLKFSQFLSSAYFTKIPEGIKKWVATLSLESGIVSGKESWLNFIEGGSENVDMSLMKEKDTIEKDMAWIFDKLQPLEDVRKGAGIEAYVYLIRDILNEFGFLASTLDSEMRDLRRTTIELLKQMSFLSALHPHPITLNEFIDVFNHLLNSTHMETEGTGVRVMDFSEMPGMSPEYIFFGGLTDGDMPRRMGLDYLLPDSVKRRLGFLHLDKYIETQRFSFHNVIKSCRNLHLSYPLMEGDDLFLPSSFLYFGEEVKERVPGIFSREEYLIRQGYKPFSNYISEIEISRLSAISHQPSAFLRVTDIDAYRMCPRRFFIERILNLEPMSVKEYELEAATIGSIIHKIMEKIIKEPFDNLEDLKKRAGAAIEVSVKDRRIDAYWKRIIKDTFMEILPDIYEKELEIRKDGYISTEVEKTLTGEPIKGIRLKGKLDRFDRIGDAVQIIDYKTGTPGLNCKQVLEGNENLQLFLYAAMMKNQGYTVSRVGIYSLKDIDIKWCPPKKGRGRGKGKENEEQGIDDYIIASLKFLEEAVKDMRKGDFKAKPLNDYSCWNCHEYAFCPYIQQ
ncbi:MAG: PD-(D/E)XK nuclease family protein [Nitrospirota bacterium]